jgi:hypothetical protein
MKSLKNDRDECVICGGRNGRHSPWCGKSRT